MIIIKDIPRTISMNKYRNSHYHTLNRLKQEFNWLFLEALQNSGYKKEPIDTPIKITFIFNYKNKRCLRDIDGNYPSCKFAIDAMVDLGLIPDDNPDYVKEITFKHGDMKDNSFDMEIKKYLHSENDGV